MAHGLDERRGEPHACLVNTEITAALIGAAVGGAIAWGISWNQATRERRDRVGALAALLLAEARRIGATLDDDARLHPDEFGAEPVLYPEIHEFARPSVQHAGEISYPLVSHFLALDGELAMARALRERYRESRSRYLVNLPGQQHIMAMLGRGETNPQSSRDLEKRAEKIRAEEAAMNDLARLCVEGMRRARDLVRHIEGALVDLAE